MQDASHLSALFRALATALDDVGLVEQARLLRELPPSPSVADLARAADLADAAARAAGGLIASSRTTATLDQLWDPKCVQCWEAAVAADAAGTAARCAAVAARVAGSRGLPLRQPRLRC